MEEGLVKIEASFVANEETTEVAELCKGAFHLPAFAIAAQRASILELDFATAAMRTDQFHAPGGEALPEPLRIVSAITNEPCGAIARTPASGPWHLHSSQGFFRETNFRG